MANIKLEFCSTGFPDEMASTDWSPQRFTHVIELMEEALNFARISWADYLFVSFSCMFFLTIQTYIIFPKILVYVVVLKICFKWKNNLF